MRKQGAGDRAGGDDSGRRRRRTGDRGAAGDVLGRNGDVSTEVYSEDLLRRLAPQVLGMLVRRHGQFDLCEDAVQEALLAASEQWPVEGMPDSPKSWLVTVASRRLVDQWRSDQARRRREEAAAAEEPAAVPDTDDTLKMLFLCCHPDLSPASQVALTLRAVGGLA